MYLDELRPARELRHSGERGFHARGSAADDLFRLGHAVFLADVGDVHYLFHARHDDYFVHQRRLLEREQRSGKHRNVAQLHHKLIPAHAERASRRDYDDGAVRRIVFFLKKL